MGGGADQLREVSRRVVRTRDSTHRESLQKVRGSPLPLTILHHCSDHIWQLEVIKLRRSVKSAIFTGAPLHVMSQISVVSSF